MATVSWPTSNSAREWVMNMPFTVALTEVRERIVTGLIACTLLFIGGCASPPDASSLVKASAELRTGVIQTGTLIAADLEQAGEEDRANRLRAEWKQPVQSATAMMNYSESLEQIVSAGKEGASAAQAVANAGEQLAQGVGIVLPQAMGAAVVTDAAAFIYGNIATARAKSSLKEILTAMQPAVERIASEVDKQLVEIGKLPPLAYRARRLKLVQQTEYRDEIGYLNYLESSRRKLYKPVTSPKEKVPPNEAEIERIDKVEQIVRVKLAPMYAEQQADAERLKQELELVANVRQAIIDWADGHRALVRAVTSGGAVDPAALEASVVNIRRLIIAVRSQ